jgi:glyoxylase-like metal-dependent hydrolase (beta-lactamase superfamily II)
MPYVLHVMPVGPLQCNCIIVGDDESREGLVVDPGGDAKRILQALDELHLRCATIVNTHAHVDHVAANAEVKRATGARLLLHADDWPLYEAMPQQVAWLAGLLPEPEPVRIDAPLAHGDVLHVGRLTARVLHTPGHSPGGICLFFAGPEPLLLSGDTLFASGIGRTDLPGGDTEALMRSIATHLLALDDRTRVIPGHGWETTIGAERRDNPFLIELTA